MHGFFHFLFLEFCFFSVAVGALDVAFPECDLGESSVNDQEEV